MQDTNSIKKWPDENTQTPTPEKITWITGLPEQILSITENTWTNLDKIHKKAKQLILDDLHGLRSIFDYDDKNWTFIIKIDCINLHFFKILYSEIYNLNINFFPDFLSKIEKENINKLTIIEIKNDGLYIDWKPIFHLVHPLIRLKQNDKLSSIFTINTRWEINLQILLDNENNYNGEHIEDLLAELQNILLSWKKVNFNKTHFIDNIYKPDEKLYFDYDWIYTWINTEKRYFFWKI